MNEYYIAGFIDYINEMEKSGAWPTVVRDLFRFGSKVAPSAKTVAPAAKKVVDPLLGWARQYVETGGKGMPADAIRMVEQATDIIRKGGGNYKGVLKDLLHRASATRQLGTPLRQTAKTTAQQLRADKWANAKYKQGFMDKMAEFIRSNKGN